VSIHATRFVSLSVTSTRCAFDLLAAHDHGLDGPARQPQVDDRFQRGDQHGLLARLLRAGEEVGEQELHLQVDARLEQVEPPRRQRDRRADAAAVLLAEDRPPRCRGRCS
jgi:hypothetical protein